MATARSSIRIGGSNSVGEEKSDERCTIDPEIWVLGRPKE